jgi:hypothetical protein
MKTYEVFIRALGQRLRIGRWTVGRKADLWDRIAYHYQFMHFKTMCEVQGLDVKQTKERFEIVEV